MPRGNQNTPIPAERRGIGPGSPGGVGVFIDNEGWKRLAPRFAKEVQRADIAIRAAWLMMAREVQVEALTVLKREVAQGGRPQREERGEPRRLERVLEYEPTENLVILRNQGFQFPDVKAMNKSPAGRYWRQVEEGSTREFEMSGLFVLPPIGGPGVAFARSQWSRPGESRNAVKFQQFSKGMTIRARLGPKEGYHYLEEAGETVKAAWRNGRGQAVFAAEFRAQGLHLLERIAARRAFEAGRGTTFHQPRFIRKG